MSGSNYSGEMPGRNRLDALFSKMCDEQLTAAELSELDDVFGRSPEARVYYRRYMNLHAAMFTYLGQEEAVAHEVEAAATGEAEQGARTKPYLVPRIPPALETPIQAQPRPKVNPVLLAAAAAVVFGIGFVAVQWAYENVPGFPGGPGRHFATLTQSIDATWAADSPVPEKGEPLGNERFRLESGSVRINFGKGADVTFTDKAEIEILDDNSVLLVSGKMLAEVPASASGFTVDTGAFEVIDIGTVFGVTIGVNGDVEVSVVEGDVELAVKDDVSGKTVRIQQLRKWQSIVAHPDTLTVEKKRYDVTTYVGMRAPIPDTATKPDTANVEAAPRTPTS